MPEFDEFIARKQAVQGASQLTHEEVVTSPEWLGLTTATPLQRVICRISDGLPIDDLLRLPIVDNVSAYPSAVQERAHWKWSVFGYQPGRMPREFAIPSAIRSYKSGMAIAKGVQMSQTVDLSKLQPGEVPRFGIVSLSIDNAKETFNKLVAAYDYSPRIREIAVARPTVDRMLLRHPSGREVEIKVLAGKRAGGSLVSRWLIGAVFDEATRMLSSEEGVVNVEDSRKAALERLLPGCQLWYPGSPWAPLGLVYNMVQEALAGELAEDAVVVRAIGAALNPSHWSPERYARLASSDKRSDREVMMTDGLAEFADAESGWVSDADLRAVTRKEPAELPYIEGYHYVACMDPATQSNAWTFVIAARDRDGVRRIFLARQWKPSFSQPLDTRVVFAELADICRRYHIGVIITDQWAASVMQERAAEVGLGLIAEAATSKSKGDEMQTLVDLVGTGEVELVDVPDLLNDLKRSRRKLLPIGATVSLPVTADGRHCDYQPSVARAIAKAIYSPDDKVEISEAQQAWTQRERDDLAKVQLEQELAAMNGEDAEDSIMGGAAGWGEW